MPKMIMVIDDEPDTVELAKTILEMEKFKVSAFNNAKDAIDALKKGNLPDLIILDMRMPLISGPDFCEKIRTDPKLKNLKIAFFTASSETDKNLLKKYSVLGFIFKPFDNDKLVKEIKRYLAM